MPYQEPPEQVLTTTKLRKDKYSADGKQVWNQYERGEQVGRGQHGVVYKGWDLANNRREVAIKVVKRNNPRNERLNKLRRRRLPSSPGHLPLSHQLASQEHKIKKEIAIMKKCRHAHVVLLYEVIDDPLFNKIYMVMEYLGGGEVKWRNKNEEPVLRVDQARRITRDVVLGLEYLHYQGIIHRDIKPANLMWTPDRRTVKITDFGVSHFSYAQRLAVAGKNPEAEDPILLDESDLSKTAGTPTFMAPEVIQDLTSESFISSNTTSPSQSQTGISLHDTSTVQLPVKARAAITKAIDVWALGVTIYCLLFGKPPFLSPLANEFQLYNVIAKEDWTLPPTMGADQIPTGKRFRPYKPPVEGQPPRDPPKIKIPNSEGAVVVNLLERLLDKNPATRMTLDELKRYIWMTRDIEDVDSWIRDTSPNPDEKLKVTEEDTNKAMSNMRFQWRARLRGVANVIRKSVRPVRSFRSAADIVSDAEADQHPIDEKFGSLGRNKSVIMGRLTAQDKGKGKQPLRPIVTRSETTSAATARRSQSVERAATSASKLQSPAAKSRRGSETLLSPPRLSDPHRASPPPSAWASGSPTSSVAGDIPLRDEKLRNRLSFQNWAPWKSKKHHSQGPGPHEASTSSSPSASGTTSPKQQLPSISSSLGVDPRVTPLGLARRSEEAFPRRLSRGSTALSPRTFGIGGGQLSSEMRASSWGEPADYEHQQEEVTSVHSDDRWEDDENMYMYGAGGVANDNSPVMLTPGPSPTLAPVSAIPATLLQRVTDDVPTHPDPVLHDAGHSHTHMRRITTSPLAKITYSTSGSGEEFSDDDDSSFEREDEEDEGPAEIPASSSSVYAEDEEDSDEDDAPPVEFKRRRPSMASSPPPRPTASDEER